MCDVQYYKEIFDRYGGMMRTTQLAEEKVFYPQREKLIADGYVEKIRRGYYQWIDPDDFSEAGTVIRLFPDAILCMDTALRYYGYSGNSNPPDLCHAAPSQQSNIMSGIVHTDEKRGLPGISSGAFCIAIQPFE